MVISGMIQNTLSVRKGRKEQIGKLREDGVCDNTMEAMVRREEERHSGTLRSIKMKYSPSRDLRM